MLSTRQAYGGAGNGIRLTRQRERRKTRELKQPEQRCRKNKKILRGEKNVPLRGHFVARKKAFKLYGVGQEEGGRGGVDFGAFG